METTGIKVSGKRKGNGEGGEVGGGKERNSISIPWRSHFCPRSISLFWKYFGDAFFSIKEGI